MLKSHTLAEKFARNPASFSFLKPETFNKNIETMMNPHRKVYNDPNVDPSLKKKAAQSMIKLFRYPKSI